MSCILIEAMTYISDLSDIPPSARLVIYGTGSLGRVLYQRIQQGRPDVRVVAFLDSFREGSFLGRPMLRPDSYFSQSQLPLADLYIVASHLWAKEMLEVLARHSASPRSISLILRDKRYAYLFLEEGQWEKEEKAVEAVFAAEDDRILWRTLMRCLRRHDPAEMIQWYLEHPGIPYLYQVSLEKGDVVLEGGVFDGSNSVEFASRVGPTGRIYGFDPWGEVVVKARGRVGLEHRSAIEVIPQALWDQPGQLYLHKSGAGTFVNECPSESGECIEATSIDAFVTERGLSRLDLIKMDIEGGEQRALAGGMQSILKYRPQLAICIYHSIEDLFSIPLKLARDLTGYRFHLFAYSPALGDIVFYAIPAEKSVQGDR